MAKLDMNECALVYGFENMDFRKVTEMLARTYWCPGIGIAEVKKGARNSALVVGARYRGRQISYARAISDRTRFAYICDVYVDEEYRNNGICTMMIDGILGHPDLGDVYQWCLVTRDAHRIYEKSGFRALANPEKWMEIRNPRPTGKFPPDNL